MSVETVVSVSCACGYRGHVSGREGATCSPTFVVCGACHHLDAVQTSGHDDGRVERHRCRACGELVEGWDERTCPRCKESVRAAFGIGYD